MKLNRKLSCLAAGLVIVAVTGSGIGYRVIAAGSTETGISSSDTEEPQMNTGNTFSEEGTTQIQTESQLPAFSVSAVTMTVEEVYVEAGSTVTEGDALLRLTDESIEDAVAYYEDTVTDAQDTLYSAQLAFQTGVLEAEYALASTQMTAEGAGDSYEASISALTVKVEEAQENYDDAVAEILKYQSAIDGGTYYLQAGVDEKQTAINTAQAALAEKQGALAAAQSTYDAAQTTIACDMQTLKAQIDSTADYAALAVLAEQVAADYTAVQTATIALSSAQVAADTAQSTLEKANQSLESAVKEYNSNVESANQKIAQLYTNLDGLQEKYEEAVRNVTTQTPELQKTYDEAVLAGKYANTEYEASLAELESAVNTAQDKLDELQEEQDALLSLEDGVICADRTGTLAAVTYEAQKVLYDSTALVSYYNTEKILISVEVDQEYIARLAVGDEVSVAITGNRGGAVTGEVYSIASSKTSGGSISNVTYAVVISIDNADGALSSGSSATVTFDYGDEEQEDAGGTN